MPYGLTSENYEFRFVGGTLTVEGSSGGGGGFIPPITVQKPTISTGEGYTVSTGSEGTTATINVQDGYELVDVTVNGVSKGEVTTLTGLKTGDKIEVTVVKKAELSEAEKVQLELAKVTKDNFKARSKQVKMKNGKKADIAALRQLVGCNEAYFGAEEKSQLACVEQIRDGLLRCNEVLVAAIRTGLPTHSLLIISDLLATTSRAFGPGVASCTRSEP